MAYDQRCRRNAPQRHRSVTFMLKWAIISAIVAIVAGAFGFGFIAGAAAGIAKVLFFIFLAVFLVLLVSAVAVGRKVKSTFRHDRDPGD